MAFLIVLRQVSIGWQAGNERKHCRIWFDRSGQTSLAYEYLEFGVGPMRSPMDFASCMFITPLVTVSPNRATSPAGDLLRIARLDAAGRSSLRTIV